MNIVRATPSDLDRIRRLMQRGRHAFQNLGREDWHGLLARGVVMLGVTGGGLFTSGTPVALLGVRREARPATLPGNAPSRAHVTVAAVARGRSATADVPPLIEAAADVLREEAEQHGSPAEPSPSWQLVYYDADNWLVRPLLAAHFAQIDRVQFLELQRLSRRVGEIHEQLSQSVAQVVDEDGRHGTIELRPAQPNDVEPLAALDGETFDPLWHMDAPRLLELLLSCHVCVATARSSPTDTAEAERLVGYAALCGPTSTAGAGQSLWVEAAASEAMLARLAVHPSAQGRGIGRRLLMDSLSAAHDRGAETVVLNTQTSNARSQALYRSLGFRRTGEIYPVLTRTA